VLALTACKAREPEFFLLPALTEERRQSDNSAQGFSLTKKETYVIADAPRGRAELKRAVDAFNRRTLGEAELASYRQRSRIFYRESRATPRHYRGNDQDWGGDALDDHWEDLLLMVVWRGSHASAYYSFYERGEAVEILDPNATKK
jgi:hypothetical protein